MIPLAYIALADLILVLWLRYRESKSPELPRWLTRGLIGIVLASAIFSFFYFLLPLSGYEQAFPIDDSYITLTAARNFVQHNLLAINPAAPLAGITSPLHALAVGLLGKLTGVETAARALGLLALLVLVAGVFVWTRQLGAPWSAGFTAASIIAIGGPLTFGALNGLETTAFAAALAWGAVLYEASEGKPRLIYAMGALAGVAILIRPEGWFFAAALFLAKAVNLIRTRRWSWPLVGAGAVALLVVLPYLLANYLTLDAIFPITVSAKKYFFAEWCRPFMRKMITVMTSVMLLIGPFLLAMPLLLWSKTWWRRLYPWLFITIFYLAYIIEFPGALGHYWGRYQHPLLALLIPGLVLGAYELGSRLIQSKRSLGVALNGLFTLLLLGGAGLGGELEHGVYRHALGTAQGYLTDVYKWIQANSQPGELVASHDIGVLYYFGQRPVLDLVGLSDPEIARVYAGARGEDCGRAQRSLALYDLVSRRKPKIVYFAPNWDLWFLGLAEMDGGRHMHLALSLPFQVQVSDNAKVKVHEYKFYLCDWETETRAIKETPEVDDRVSKELLESIFQGPAPGKK